MDGHGIQRSGFQACMGLSWIWGGGGAFGGGAFGGEIWGSFGGSLGGEFCWGILRGLLGEFWGSLDWGSSGRCWTFGNQPAFLKF